jgi:2-amino-4-hydroxy-6-hydroxymethyldihydropteridine diphosphokinase
MTKAFIGMGSNQGNRRASIVQAARDLMALPRTRVTRFSSLYDSEPVGDPGLPRFLNAVAQIETALDPDELLRRLHGVEARMGRSARDRSGARDIDLDLLFYGDRVIDSPSLQVPHPRGQERLFVLIPMAEIAPDWKDPRTGLRMDALLRERKDQAQVGWSSSFPVNADA